MTALVNMAARFNAYKANEAKIWEDRFIFRDPTERDHSRIYETSIIKFAKATKAFDKIRDVKDVNELFDVISELANTYYNWCITNIDAVYMPDYNKGSQSDEMNVDDMANPELMRDLTNHFKGAIGEYFFYVMLNEIRTLNINLDKTSNNGRRNVYPVTFNNVCPRLLEEKDFGVDLTGSAIIDGKEKNIAIQVKFWKPDTKNKINWDIITHLHADAIGNNKFVDGDDDGNMYVCCLSDCATDSRKSIVSYNAAETDIYKKNIVFIDGHDVNGYIGNTWPAFKRALAKFGI